MMLFSLKPKISSSLFDKFCESYQVSPSMVSLVADGLQIQINDEVSDFAVVDALAHLLFDVSGHTDVSVVHDGPPLGESRSDGDDRIVHLAQAYLALLKITPKSDLEARIMTNDRWRTAVLWGHQRPGHPEGKVVFHIREVLDNVEKLARPEQVADARVLSLLHDSFKGEVDAKKHPAGENHHARRAMRFAQQVGVAPYLAVLIDLHDEAHNAFMKGARDDNWPRALERLSMLRQKISGHERLYHLFFACDSFTGDKDATSLKWLEREWNLEPILRPV